jgi:2',3'-cyclic-nucleotide 2'-phosphodiesterase (5'-nucleotidase family)
MKNSFIGNILFATSMLLFSFDNQAQSQQNDSTGQASDTSQISNDFQTKKLTLVFTGDVMGHDSQINSAYDAFSRNYNYRPNYEFVAPYIQHADVAVANLEVTLAGPPFKGYPQFSSPDQLATALQEAGFDLLITANNHSLDRGKRGLIRTYNVLDSMGFLKAGTYPSVEKRALEHPLVFEKNGIKIALLNFTYGTNGIKPTGGVVVNIIQPETIKKELAFVKQHNPDFIIATMHWGSEYQREENEYQQNLAKLLFENGADLVVGSHPHVVQSIKKYGEDKLVAYSLGNYISNQRKRYTDGGIMLEVTIEKDSAGTGIEDFKYLATWVYKKYHDGKVTFQILPPSLYPYIKDRISISASEKAKMEQFYQDTRDHLQGIKESDFYKEGK